MRILRLRLAGCGLIVGLTIFSGCAGSPAARRDKYIASGKQFLEKKDYLRALLNFRNAMKAMPLDAETYYYTGLAFAGSGDPINAARSFEKALSINPKHTEAKLRLAQLKALAGDEEAVRDAQKNITELMEATPGSPEILKTLAVTELKLGQTEDAVHSLEQAVVLAPEDAGASLLLAKAKLMQRDYKGAEEVLKKAIAAAPKVEETQLALGQVYVLQNRFAEAEEMIRRVLQGNSSSGLALRNLAVLQNGTGRKKEAEENFKKLSGLGESAYEPLYGMFLLSEGRQDEAIREFERLANAHRDDRAARNRLVLAYEIAGKQAEARRVVDQALKKHPGDVDALLQRAQMNAAAKQFVEAELDLTLVLKQRPDSAEAHYTMGKIQQGQGKTFQYRQELFKALELDAALLSVRIELTANLIQSGNTKEALNVLEQAPQSQKDSLAILVQRNWALWASNDLQEMRKGIDAGLARGRSTELLIQDGMWKLRAGNIIGARAVLDEALKMNPGDLRALSALKDSYVVTREAGTAVQKVKEYAAREPKSAPVQEFLGFVLSGAGDTEGARTAFAAAKAADPGVATADLAQVQMDVMEKRWDAAIGRLTSVLASNPMNLTARLWLGNLQLVKGNNAAALENFRKAVDASPDNPQALNNLAYLLAEEANQPDQALKHAQRAVQSEPDNSNYVDTLGWILYRKGLYQQAIQQLEHAAGTGGSPLVKYHLAMAYAKAGDFKRGRSVYSDAMKQNPRLPEAHMAAELLAPAGR